MKAEPQHYHAVLAPLVSEINELLSRMQVSVATFATNRPKQYYDDRQAASEEWLRNEINLCRALGKSNPPTYVWHKWEVDVRERGGGLEFRWQISHQVRNRRTGSVYRDRTAVKQSGPGGEMNMNRLLGDSHESVKHLTRALELELRDVREVWDAIQDTRTALNRVLRGITVREVDKRTRRLSGANSRSAANPCAGAPFDLIKVPGTGPKRS